MKVAGCEGGGRRGFGSESGSEKRGTTFPQRKVFFPSHQTSHSHSHSHTSSLIFSSSFLNSSSLCSSISLCHFSHISIVFCLSFHSFSHSSIDLSHFSTSLFLFLLPPPSPASLSSPPPPSPHSLFLLPLLRQPPPLLVTLELNRFTQCHR